MLPQMSILLAEASTVVTFFRGADPNSGQWLEMHLGPVDTNLSKPTQSLLAAVFRRDLPELGYEPIIRFLDGKTLPPEHLGKELKELISAGYADYRRTIPYAGGQVDVYQLGKGLDVIRDQLVDFDLMGITSNFTFESGQVLEAISIFKTANPKGKVIVGGRDATYRPAHYLCGGADAVVIGEGDQIAAQLAVSLYENHQTCIPGVAYRRGGSLVGLDWKPLRAPINDTPLPYFFRPEEILRSDLPGGQLEYYRESQDGPLLYGVQPPVFHFRTSTGCVYRCPFCATGGMSYDCMSLDNIRALLQHLHASGVRTLISAEDAFLERVIALGRERGREEVIEIMRMIREYEFAIEWANGVNYNTLFDPKAQEIDCSLLDAVFTNWVSDEKWVGTYRWLIPAERLGNESGLRKLVPTSIQMEIASQIAERHQIPSGGIAWILRPEDTPDQIEQMKQSVIQLRSRIHEASRGKSTTRLGLFCLMPHPGSGDAQLEKLAAFGIEEYPELRHYFLSVLNGQELGGMGYDELFWYRLQLLKELDPETYQSWMTQGGYKR